MNIRNWNNKKKIAALFAVVLIVLGLVSTILVVQMQQDTRTRAEKATSLALSPGSQDASLDDVILLDLNIDPGTNQVNFAQIVINFEPQKFDSNATVFELESASNFSFVNQPIISQGQIVITVNTGSNPTDVIRTPQKIGTLNLKVRGEGEFADIMQVVGETQVTFNEGLTEIRSIGSEDTFFENVLSTTTPASINIQAICQENIATCTWDPVAGASSYDYVITDTDSDSIVLEGSTTETFAEFSISSNVNYSCSVTASNTCGDSGLAGEASGICVDTTPTPSPEPTITPSLTPTPEPTLPPGISPTPSSTPSATLTPTPTMTPTPTPTLTPTSTPTLTPTSTLTPTPTTVAQATSTPIPTEQYQSDSSGDEPIPTYPTDPTPTPLPAPGSPLVVLGSLVGAVFVIMGGLLLLIL